MLLPTQQRTADSADRSTGDFGEEFSATTFVRQERAVPRVIGQRHSDFGQQGVTIFSEESLRSRGRYEMIYRKSRAGGRLLDDYRSVRAATKKNPDIFQRVAETAYQGVSPERAAEANPATGPHLVIKIAGTLEIQL